MKTLTVTEARRNLSGWLRRAGAGEEIGIVDGALIYALRPVSVIAADYALAEYGATPGEVEAAVARARGEIVTDRANGRLTSIFPDEAAANAPRRRATRRPAAKRPRRLA